MAWCLWQQRLVSEALSSGGLTVFSTVDGSPQGGYQWELEGHIYVKNSDLAELRQQALVLIMSTMVVEDGAEANDQDRDDVPEEIKEAFDKLTQALNLVQAPPVACGSGASSVWHKVHAFCHAHRLVSPSWEAVASVVASVFTITGDLGTESGFSSFHAPLESLFGPWVKDTRPPPWRTRRRESPPDPGREHIYEPIYETISGPETPPSEPSFQMNVDTAEGVELQQEPSSAAELFHISADQSHSVAHSMDTVSFDIRVDGDMDLDAGEEVTAQQPEDVNDFALEPGDETYVDFRRSVYIPGVLHIIHNISMSLSVVLSFWPSFLPQLKEVARMLKRKSAKTRLLERCFNRPPHSYRKKPIQEFRADVYEGRWGNILSACVELLPCEEALRSAWDATAYGGQREIDSEAALQENMAGGEAKRGVKVTLINEAIMSDMFWATCKLIDVLGEVLLAVAAWSESCPCHHSSLRISGSTRHFRKKRLKLLYGRHRCPLQTLRAPEAAAGGLFEYLDKILSIANAFFRMHPSVQRLTENEIAQLLADFARARRLITFGMQVKLSFWRGLPYVLCGLAHWDIDVVRAIARRAFLLYERAPAGVRNHWWCQVLLSVGSQGRRQLEAWLANLETADLPDFDGDGVLGRMCARFTFVAVSERWIEARHSLTNRALCGARHGGVVFLAFTVLYPTLVSLLKAEGALEEFSSYSHKVRNALFCIEQMGLSWHPRVQQLVEESGNQFLGGANRQHRAELIRIIYHLDSFSLFRRAGKVQSDRPPPPPPRGLQDGDGSPPSLPLPCSPIPSCFDYDHFSDVEPAGDAGDKSDACGTPVVDLAGTPVAVQEDDVDKAVAAASVDLLYEALWVKYACKHIKFMVSVTDHPGAYTLFSIGPRMVTARGHITKSFSSVVCPDATPVVAPIDFNITADLAEGPSRPEPDGDIAEHPLFKHQSADALDSRDVFFFSLVSSKPSSAVVAQWAPHVEESDAMLVCLHDVYEVCRRPKWRVRVSIEEADGTGSKDLQALDPHMLRREDIENAVFWKSSLQVAEGGGLQYDFGCSFPPDIFYKDAQMAIQQLADGSPERPYILAASSAPGILSVYQWLHQLRYVGRHQESEFEASWFLSPLGRATLRLSQLVFGGRKLVDLTKFAEKRDTDCDVFECLLRLEDRGFKCCTKGKGGRSKRVLGPADDALRQPVDYLPGDAALFWIREKDKSFCVWYLRALLTAAVRPGVPLRHFQLSSSYRELVTGKRKKVRRKGFTFVSRLDASIPAPEVTIEEGGSGTDGSCKSSSHSSDSSSSSSSSDEAAGSDVDEVASDDPSPVESPVPKEDGAVDSDEDLFGDGDWVPEVAPAAGPRCETNFVWKSFLFTATYDSRTPGVVVGYQCSCGVMGHACKPLCQRTRNFKAHGGRENTIAMLKHWAIMGFSLVGPVNHENRTEHCHLVDVERAEDRLTDAELEAFEVDPAMVDRVAEFRHRKRTAGAERDADRKRSRSK